MGRGKGMTMIPVLDVALLTDDGVKYIYIWWFWLDLLSALWWWFVARC